MDFSKKLEELKFKPMDEVSEDLPQTEGEVPENTRLVDTKDGNIKIVVGKVVNWDVLKRDAIAIFEEREKEKKFLRPEDKQALLMTVCSLFGFPTSFLNGDNSSIDEKVDIIKNSVQQFGNEEPQSDDEKALIDTSESWQDEEGDVSF